jgi:hypothetical protein
MPGATQANGTIVITGATGDYGKASGHVGESGTPDQTGTYGLVALQKGTLTADLAGIEKAVNDASPIVDSPTPGSFAVAATAPSRCRTGPAKHNDPGAFGCRGCHAPDFFTYHSHPVTQLINSPRSLPPAGLR